MNLSRLIPPSLAAVSILLPAVSQAAAVQPAELTLKESGEILLTTDSLPPMQIRTEVKDVSSGEWKNTKVIQKCAPAGGTEVERTQTYVFPDGSEVTHTVDAKIAGNAVDVAASWVAPAANPPGFSRVDLWIPEDLAGEISITIGDQTVFPRAEGQTIKTYATGGPVVVKRRSNGEFLFQLTGDFMSVTPAFYPEQSAAGLTLRLLNVPADNTAKIGDNTQLKWSLSFKQP